jgi:hypothetical protein
MFLELPSFLPCTTGGVIDDIGGASLALAAIFCP